MGRSLKQLLGKFSFKLDIEKKKKQTAYNYVNWKLLFPGLQKMGFGHKWRKWIHFWLVTLPQTFSTLLEDCSKVIVVLPNYLSWWWKLSAN